MFENLLYQSTAVERLSREAQRDRLAPSLLFYGPEYAGKLSAALELARGLTCETPGAPWNCTCRNCISHRLLEYPYLLLMGSRSFREEIAASEAAFRKEPRGGARFLYIRSLRKLTRRFDAALWPPEDKNYKKSASPLSEINDNIDTLLEEGADVRESLDDLLESNRRGAEKLQSLLPQGNIPVQHIRNLLKWIHSGSSGARRVVVIENADVMQDSSRNALLKLLEEPPAGLTLILLTQRRSAILPTLLSRLRPYAFIERQPQEQQEVLQRVFKETSGEFPDLRRFFLAWKFEQPVKMKDQALHFIRGVENPDTDFQSLSLDAAGRGKDPRLFTVFLEELSLILQEWLRGEFSSSDLPDYSPGELAVWNQHIQECRRRREQLNQGIALLLESLFYTLRHELRLSRRN